MAVGERGLARDAGPVTRPWARAAALTGFAAALAGWSFALGIPNDTLQVFGWLWLGTIAWHIEAQPRYHLNFLRDWWAPVAGLVIYFFSRGLSDELGITPHVQMPIDVDTWLGAGVTPTQRLQEAWCGDPCVRTIEPRWYDMVLTTVYASHFVTGLTIAAVLWVRNRVEWVRWMRRYLMISFGALVGYIAYPMEPPWMAAQHGALPGSIHRVTGRGWADLGLSRFDLALQGVSNPVAAMPSLHAGMTFLIAGYAIQRWSSPARWLLLAYPLAMSLALVYAGEHYVIDVIAGALLAAVVLVTCRLWEGARGG